MTRSSSRWVRVIGGEISGDGGIEAGLERWSWKKRGLEDGDGSG